MSYTTSFVVLVSSVNRVFPVIDVVGVAVFSSPIKGAVVVVVVAAAIDFDARI